MTVNTNKKRLDLDTPLLTFFQLNKMNWEIALYIAIFIVAVITRFYGLGMRAMSHDESLHTLYSWNLYVGKGYSHSPMMHGPFLFHITAFVYFLFGDNDFTARTATAVFGIALVIMPYWFKPWLGRLGALSASLMILISPGLLYYSRYIRHDIFISVWTGLMFLAFFQYMRTRRVLWLYIGAAAVSLMLSTKEVAYIHGFIGFTFIVVTLMWENIPKSAYKIVTYSLIVLVLFGVGAIFYLNGLPLPPVPVEGEATGFDASKTIGIVIMVTGLLIGFIIIQRGADRLNRPVTSAITNIREQLFDLSKAIILAVVIFVLLYTTFFSNLPGLVSGTVGAVKYWLEQQNVQRGGQPWYYYLFLMPMYEFLPVLVGIIGGLVYLGRKKIPAHADDNTMDTVDMPKTEGGIIYPSDGGTFAVFVIYWALIATVIYSWAGEKMPWLTVHMTLPLIFVAGHVIQTTFGDFNWAEARRKGGFIFGGLLLLIIPAVVMLVSADPFRSQSLEATGETAQFIAALVIFVLLIVALWRFGRQLGVYAVQKITLTTVLLVLVLLTIRFAWMFTFINYDYVNEMLVYAHASPDVKLALNQIDDISRRTVGDKMIAVAYDNDSTWPLEWYMREYPNRVFYGENPTREALDVPIVIVGSANESKVKPFLGDKYVRFRYRLVWWPIEDYKDQTLTKLWQNYVTGPSPADGVNETDEAKTARREIARNNRARMWGIIFYREYEGNDLNEWPFVHLFFMYVRKDVLADMWDYQNGPVPIIQTVAQDPYEGKRTETDALKVWGTAGTGDGQFAAPRNLAVGTDGLIYVADSGNNRIQVFNKDGSFKLKWGSEGAGTGQFSEPWGIAVSDDGTVYVADTWNHRVQAFSSDGKYLFSFGEFANAQTDSQVDPGKFWGPRGIALDADGNLYITDTGNKRVQKFSSDGKFLQTWGGGGVIPGSFEEPVGIDIDSQGNIYVADVWNRRIQKFDANFAPVVQWDVVGWDSETIVNKPFLAIDANDNLFISDPEGYRIIGYNNNQELLVSWGQYGKDNASFGLPVGIVFDGEGNLLVADSDNNRIMRFIVPNIQPVDESSQ